MRRLIIKAGLIVLAVIAVILITGVVILRILIPPVLSKEATEKEFEKNQDNIKTITDYLINSKYDDVYMSDTDDSGTMYKGSGQKMSIDDSQVINAVDTLLKYKGFSVIAKDGNTIHFQRSTRLMDFGSGIAYSIDGNEPQLEFLTKLEPMSEPNWYYYEEDFNEFKRRDESEE